MDQSHHQSQLCKHQYASFLSQEEGSGTQEDEKTPQPSASTAPRLPLEALEKLQMAKVRPPIPAREDFTSFAAVFSQGEHKQKRQETGVPGKRSQGGK